MGRRQELVRVAIGGITGDHPNYLGKNLDNSKFDSRYQFRYWINTERYFDKLIVNIESIPTAILGVLPGVRKYWDKYGDFIKYYLNKKRRIDVCLEVRRKLNWIQKTHPRARIDVIAHSLGTVILASSKPDIKLGKVYLMGSPLGLQLKWARKWTQKHLQKFIDDFDFEEIHYLWAKDDHVSCSSFKDDHNIPNTLRLAKGTILVPEHNVKDYDAVSTNHDSMKYINYMGDNF